MTVKFDCSCQFVTHIVEKATQLRNNAINISRKRTSRKQRNEHWREYRLKWSRCGSRLQMTRRRRHQPETVVRSAPKSHIERRTLCDDPLPWPHHARRPSVCPYRLRCLIHLPAGLRSLARTTTATTIPKPLGIRTHSSSVTTWLSAGAQSSSGEHSHRLGTRCVPVTNAAITRYHTGDYDYRERDKGACDATGMWRVTVRFLVVHES